MHVRVCVECGEEFRPEVAHCSDCGGRLEDRYDDGAGARLTRAATAAPAEPDLQPLPGARPVVWSADARDLVALADQLMATGLAFRITPRAGPGASGFDLCVRDPDRGAAVRALAPLTGAGSGVALLEALAGEGDEAEGDPRCPACGSPVPQGATECSGCGLGLEGEPPD